MESQVILSVDFSYCWINLEVLKYSLEQYIGFVEDKLSTTTVVFIRSDEDYSSSWKLVFLQNQCTVPENTSRLQDMESHFYFDIA